MLEDGDAHDEDVDVVLRASVALARDDGLVQLDDRKYDERLVEDKEGEEEREDEEENDDDKLGGTA